jgi:ribosomal protein L11 methyltransferase
MDSIQISIQANEEEQEILISELSEFGADGFEQTDTHLIAFFSEHSFKSYDVNELLKDFSFHINTIKEQNWNELWENNFQPVIVDDFCAIRAQFHKPVNNVQYEIIITPKMSFGTGHHATTFLMIEQMRSVEFLEKKVFDFGTGTGILAILAEKLGAADIGAIDVDDWSIVNSKENIEANNCNRIHVRQSSRIPGESYDVILANINRNIILQYLRQLTHALVPAGRILFSGLLKTDQNDIVEACIKEGFILLKQTEKDNWISLLFVNRA